MGMLEFLSVVFTQQQILIIVLLCVVLAIAIAVNVLLIYFYRKRKKRKLCMRQLQERREQYLKKLDSMNSGELVIEGPYTMPAPAAAEDDEKTDAAQEAKTQNPDAEIEKDVKDDGDGDDDEEIAATQGSEAEDLDEEIEEEDEDDDDDEDGEESEEVEEDDDDDADDIDDRTATEQKPASAELEITPSYKILAVRDMSPSMRAKFEVTGAEYARKQYYVRYAYSFDAKLRAAAPEVQQRYKMIVDEMLSYKGVKLRKAFKLQRVTKGRKTLALILFRGKTLCVAFALDPADYSDSKYRGVDMSGRKRFAATPMMLKLTSNRKTVYAKYLFVHVADVNTIMLNACAVPVEYDFASKTDRELFDMNAVRIYIAGEAPDLDEDEYSDPIDETEDETADDIADDSVDADDADDWNEVVPQPAPSELTGTPAHKTLAVRDMSPSMRVKFNVTGAEYARKRYYVRYSFGFDAKLRASAREVRQWYMAIVDEMLAYKGVKLRKGFRQYRITKGRKTLAIILFRGKTLCVAYALDPAEYANTKYRGADVSERKRFAATPMLLKLTSNRRAVYAEYLAARVAERNTTGLNAHPATTEYDFAPKTDRELFDMNAMRIYIIGEAPDLDGSELEKTLRYDRSFDARIIQISDAVKTRYSDIKNRLLSYKKVRAQKSWRKESFRFGRKTIAVVTVRGKSLYISFATDPARFDGTKYKVRDKSVRSPKCKQPCLLKVSSDRRAKYAMEIIDLLLTEAGAVPDAKFTAESYTPDFSTTDELIRNGLIKVYER